MSFNISFIGQLVLISMLVIGGLGYYLGKRKTGNPKITALIGAILCITPPLNLVFLVVLLLKNDLVRNEIGNDTGNESVSAD